MFANFGDQIIDDCLDKIIELRQREIPCEIYPLKSKLKKQLDYANQKEIPFVIIIGPDEYSDKNFMIKDMKTGNQRILDFKDLVDEIMKII